MTKLDVILLAMLLASSLLAVNNAYESRRVFSELDRARQVQVQLDAEFKRLDAERQAQGTHLLVEKAAREKLKMRTASPAVTAYVFDAAASEGAR
ncbi:MAG: cell division protein FtsL [Rubrivivax sp.]|jgi:cell division protein FtsL|nr:cell division protein FtsL [Betaproteobacteria bacterium]MBP6317595.1 cell division protein FtsL [Rubrivivax sp.]MBK7459581.1 cell division protein FtsL [Betaproteobacteria bacterium]MBK7517723.1 cell division protein FtsL [Betaproteobacteria bacterium]MBK8105492.1 cell division protein FtsL [Betaproteobacteria bacterium]